MTEKVVTLDLVLKLIEKVIGLARESKNVKKNQYLNFIEPLLASLDDVHKEYITSFQNYRDAIKSEGDNFTLNNAVFSLLEDDMIFSDASRNTLWSMLQPIEKIYPEFYLYRDRLGGAETSSWKNENLEKLICGVSIYVDNVWSSSHQYANAPRNSLLESLSEVAEGKKIYPELDAVATAERLVLEKMWDMQRRYYDVQFHHHHLKLTALR